MHFDMPDIVIEMQSSPSTSRTFIPSGSAADGDRRTSPRPTQGQSGAEFDFPGGDCKTDSRFKPASGGVLPAPSSSSDPPSYKEAVFGENDPLIPKPVPSAPPPKETQPKSQRDVSSLIVMDPPAEEETDNCIATCCVVGMRVLCFAGIFFGILLVYWEKVFQASFGPNPDSRTRKQFHLREGFGWTMIVFGVLMYVCDGCTSFKKLDDWSKKDLLEHLEKVKRGTPKLTWYMTTFNRDVSTAVITNADGSRRTEERNDKTTTWSGTQRFQFSEWADVTPDQIDTFGTIKKITFHSRFILADEETKRAYEAQKQAFIDVNKDKGQEYSIEEIFEIEGFEKKLETIGPDSLINWCMCYLTFLTIFCYYPWLCCVSASTRTMSCTFVKELSV